MLPLENLSRDPTHEYRSAGIHDDLIASLSRISSLQENETTRAITETIKGRLSLEDEQMLAKKTEVRPETYESYLRGTFQMHKETPDGYKRGIAIMTEAIELNLELHSDSL